MPTYGLDPPRDDKDASLLPQHFPDVLFIFLHQILHLRPSGTFWPITRARNAVAETLFVRVSFPFRAIMLILVCRPATKVQRSI
jgi:hypothetical protein